MMAQLLLLNNELGIERYALDEELIRQPELFSTISLLVAECVSLRDEGRDISIRIHAETSERLREQLLESGGKLTETRLEELVNLDPAYIHSRDEYLASKALADRASSLKEAFLQRSFMLRDLVSLHISGYTMQTSVSEANRDQKALDLIKRQEELKTIRREIYSHQ
jgi:hypothetical protein